MTALQKQKTELATLLKRLDLEITATDILLEMYKADRDNLAFELSNQPYEEDKATMIEHLANVKILVAVCQERSTCFGRYRAEIASIVKLFSWRAK